MTKRLILGRFTEKQLTEAVNDALLGFNDTNEKINSLVNFKDEVESKISGSIEKVEGFEQRLNQIQESSDHFSQEIINIKSKFNSYVDLDSEQTISGAKTFSNIKVPEPLDNSNAVNAEYVLKQISKKIALIVGSLENIATDDKTNIINAINEIYNSLKEFKEEITEEYINNLIDLKLQGVLESTNEKITLIEENLNRIDTELEGVVKYKEFTLNEIKRKTIELENQVNITGKKTDGTAVNIGMVSKWDKVDIGASQAELNFNGNQERPTYNIDKQIALLDDLNQLNDLINTKANKSEIPDISGLATKEELQHVSVDTSNLTTKAEFNEFKAQNTQSLNLKADRSEIPDISGLATKEELQNVSVDTSNLTTKTEFNEFKIQNEQSLDLKADRTEIPDISGLATKEELQNVSVDTSNLTTKAEFNEFKTQNEQSLDLKADRTEIPDISGLATKEEFNEFKTQTTQSLDLKANSSDIPDISGLATKEELQNVSVDTSNLTTKAEFNEFKTQNEQSLNLKADRSDIPDISGLATKEELQNVSVDTSNLTTKAEFNEFKTQTTQSLDSKADRTDITGLATKTEFNEFKTQTTQSLDLKANKTEIPDISGLATKEELQQVSVDTSNLTTKEEFNEFKTQNAQSLDSKADRTEISGLATKVEFNEFKTQTTQSLDSKADISDIPDISGLATKEELQQVSVDTSNLTTKAVFNEFKDQTTQSLDSKADRSDISGLATKAEFNEFKAQNTQSLNLKADRSEIPDISGLATKEELQNVSVDTSNLTTKTEFNEFKIQNEQSLDLKADRTEIPDISGLATKVEFNEFKTQTTQSLDSKANRSEIPDISGLATKEELQNVSVDTSNLTTKAEFNEFKDQNAQSLDSKADRTEISGLATKVEFNEFKTQTTQSLDLKANSSDIPDISGLATKEELQNVSVDTSNLTTKAEFNEFKTQNEQSLALKADRTDIPDISGLATLDTEQSITGKKIFETIPEISNDASKPLEVTNLKTVKNIVNDLENEIFPIQDIKSLSLSFTLSGDRYGGGCLSDLLFITDELEPSGSFLTAGNEKKILIPIIINPGLPGGKLGSGYPGVVVLVTYEYLVKKCAKPGVDLSLTNIITKDPSSYSWVCEEFWKKYPHNTYADFSVDDVKQWLSENGIEDYILGTASQNNIYETANARFTPDKCFWRMSQCSVFGRGSATTVTINLEWVGRINISIYDIVYSPYVWYNTLDYNTSTILNSFYYIKLNDERVDIITEQKTLQSGTKTFQRFSATDSVFESPLFSKSVNNTTPYREHLILENNSKDLRVKARDIILEGNAKLENSLEFANLQDNNLLSKKNIVDNFIGKDNIIISEIEPDVEKPVGTLWIKTSYVQDPSDQNIFTDIPAIYISLGAKGWWDLHYEGIV